MSLKTDNGTYAVSAKLAVRGGDADEIGQGASSHRADAPAGYKATWKNWTFGTPARWTTVDPLGTRSLSALICILGARHRHRRSSPSSSLSSYSLCAWSTILNSTYVLLSLMSIVLYALGLCDTLYFLFTCLVPIITLTTRLRFKPWVTSGDAAAQLEFAFRDLPLSPRTFRLIDTMFLLLWVFIVAVTVTWGSFTLWIPLLWDENASAFPLAYTIPHIFVEILTWVTGAPSYFCYIIISQVTALAMWIKVRRTIKATRDLYTSWESPERSDEVVRFVNECLPRHMELSKAMQMFNRGASTMTFFSLSGLVWLVIAAYINAFIVPVPHDSLIWRVRPWTTFGLFSFVLTAALMPVALLTATMVEYVRETEILLGLIAVSDTRLTLSFVGEGEGGENIAERAKRDLILFASVQDLCYIRVLGVAVSGTMLLQLFYLLVAFFVLPLVANQNS